MAPAEFNLTQGSPQGAASAPAEINLTQIGQVGIVVRNLETAMETYSRALGIGPWKIHTNSAPPLRVIYRGKPASYRVRVAIAQAGPVNIELIEYLEGDTIHRDFLEEGREGVEHLGIYVKDLQSCLDLLAEKGIGVLQSAEGMGTKGDGRYAYLDTVGAVGTVLELIQSPSDRLPPERIYP